MEERDDKGRFVPGHTGGPGRPKKGEALTDILQARIDKEELAEMLIGRAREGDLAAVKYIYDRIDGRPKETVEQTVFDMPKVIRFEAVDGAEDRDTDEDS